MSAWNLPQVTIKKPYGWTRDKSHINCMNPHCQYTTWEENGTPLRTYSPGEDNGDGTIRLNFNGYCLNCIADYEQDEESMDW